MKEQTISLTIRKAGTLLLSVVLLFGTIGSLFPIVAYAKESSKEVAATVYQFDEDSKYELDEGSVSDSLFPGASLVVSGDIYRTSEKNGVPAYAVKRDYTSDVDYNLTVEYARTTVLTGTQENIWTLTEDSSKKVDTVALDGKVGKGAIIVQTSKDRNTWVTSSVETNVFEDNPSANEATYASFKTNDVQLANGCYYRVIVAYKLSKPAGSSQFLFIKNDKYEYVKQAEVYEFYVYDVTAESTTVPANTKKFNLGTKVRTEKFEGYYGSTTISNKDPHYGWDIGQFFISGYSDSIKDSDGNIVFLKNVGDQVSLWFNLTQNLDALNGNPKLTLQADSAGSDQFFETPTVDFGKGALIIRKTTYENVTETPVIYTNYLEASATVGANTKVDLFEEGDYEVALDYCVKNDKIVVFGNSILPGESHYRIYFKFSVRNANSMFYPRDVKTTSELANNSFTRNGFYLDLANSRYLRLNIVKEVLKDGATGLTEDVRFNTSAKDGDSYSSEGIYTITVTNQYTNKSTTKTIYVGDNNILKAYMVSGLSISEINERVANGATIADDGSIIDPIPVETETPVPEETTIPEEVSVVSEETTIEELSTTETVEEDNNDDNNDNNVAETETHKSSPIGIVVAVVVAMVVGISGLIAKKNKSSKKENDGK